MEPIALFKHNMDISKNVLEMTFEEEWAATAQKIAVYTVLPFAMIVFFEAIVKNLIAYNALNLTICGINWINDCFRN